MIYFLLSCIAIWLGISKYLMWKGARSKGRRIHSPKIDLQVEGSTIARPKQGSSRGETTDSGLLYLISHSGFKSAKIGISSNASKGDRLQDHTQYGWRIDGLWNFERLRNAEQVEGAVIAWWRNTLSLPPSCKAAQMPQGGYTETVSLLAISINQIAPFVEDLVEKTDGQKAIQVPINKVIPGASMRIEGKLKHASLGTRTASFQGNYGVSRVHHEWHRWVLDDGTGELLVEIRDRDAIPLRKLRIGSRIEATGRIEKIGPVYRMTNPVYRVTEVGKSGKAPRQEMTNEGKQITQFRLLSRRNAPTPNSKPITASKVVKQNSNRMSPPRTGFETKLEQNLKQQVNLSSAHLAERCSSCGALVPNGAAHDC